MVGDRTAVLLEIFPRNVGSQEVHKRCQKCGVFIPLKDLGPLASRTQFCGIPDTGL
jgi:hypothetical protein